MFWLVVLGFVLGVLIAIPVTLFIFGFGMTLTAKKGKTYTLVDGNPKWVDNEQK